jgi:hypothetical protein
VQNKTTTYRNDNDLCGNILCNKLPFPTLSSVIFYLSQFVFIFLLQRISICFMLKKASFYRKKYCQKFYEKRGISSNPGVHGETTGKHKYAKNKDK